MELPYRTSFSFAPPYYCKVGSSGAWVHSSTAKCFPPWSISRVVPFLPIRFCGTLSRRDLRFAIPICFSRSAFQPISLALVVCFFIRSFILLLFFRGRRRRLCNWEKEVSNSAIALLSDRTADALDSRCARPILTSLGSPPRYIYTRSICFVAITLRADYQLAFV